MPGKTYGYVRVSTRGQREDRQLAAMQEFGVPAEYIVIEKQSGKDFVRPLYLQLVGMLKPGDVLVVKSIEEIFPLVTKVFYEPNIKMMQSRYERNCKLLKKYPYLFRKDFLPFEELPVRFYPYDDSHGYVPFYREQQTFGDYVNFKNPVISRNFFKDLENPVLAEDVTSQYELEYLRDNVRKSEYVGRENHVYLHYTDWSVFCSYLQCLNMRPLLEEEKLVFLIEDERSLYPIDFKARFGIDYSQYSIKLVGIQEITRLIWHTQLSTHNGGDFFNEVFDNHPNLLVLPSIMMSNAVENVKAFHA